MLDARPEEDKLTMAGLRLMCPTCRSALSAIHTKSLTCAQCAASYSVQDGIPIIRNNENYYHELLPKACMQELIRRTREVGWRTALAEQIAEAPERNRAAIHTVFADESRGAFKSVLPPLHDRRVLDLGCGSGITSVALARWAREVVACDLTFERVAFLALRAREERLFNIRAICAGDTRPLPFADASFDCVILNGVLEWSAADGHDPVRAGQIEFLREIGRILKSDGHLYIGIENRFGYRYFLGAPEDHTGVKYAALAPRWLADLVVGRTIGRPYRTYTYGYAGMSTLLKEVGFSHRRFFAPIPDYRDFREIYPLDLPATSLGAPTGAWRRRLKARLERNRWVTPSFAVISSARPVSPSWVEALVAELALRHSIQGDGTFPRVRTSATSTAGLIIAIGHEAIVRVPLDPPNEARVARNFAGIARAQLAVAACPQMNSPKPLATGKLFGVYYAVESFVAGTQYADLTDQGKMAADRKLFDLLIRFKTSSPGLLPPPDARDVWRNQVLDRLRTSITQLRNGADRGLATELLTIAESIEQVGIPPALTHGDLWCGNVLFAGEDKPLVLIDWDRWAEYDLATHDLLHYICYRRVLRNRSNWPDEFSAWLDGTGEDALEADGIHRFADVLGLGSGWKPLAALAYWVRELSGHHPSKLDLDRDWSSRIIQGAAPTLLRHIVANTTRA